MAPLARPEEPGAPDFYSAAIYGSIVAAALLAPFHEEHVAPRDALLALVSTMVVFWLAHAWSTIAGERIQLGQRFTFGRALELARSEWPLVEAGLAPAFVLVLGWAGVLADQTSLTLAVVVCIAQLVAWGLVIGHRAFDRPLQVIAAGLLDGALGVALVALEIVVVHR